MDFSQQFHQNTVKRLAAIGDFCLMWVVVLKMVGCSAYDCMGRESHQKSPLFLQWKRNAKWENFRPGRRAALLQVNVLQVESRMNGINKHLFQIEIKK